MTDDVTTTGPADAPALERLNYYFGQQLGVRDFEAEQTYFREKLKRHNRCLHGHGIVSGLWVSAGVPGAVAAAAAGAVAGGVADAAKPAATAPPPQFVVWVAPGLALDPEGNELSFAGTSLDLWHLMSREQRRKWAALKPGGVLPVYLALTYRDVLAAPRRPAAVDPCRLPRDREYGRVRDGACAVVLDADPFAVGASDEACDTCAGAAVKNVVVLARVDLPRSGDLTDAAVHPDARRPVGRYPFNRVVGVNWVHGGWYGSKLADKLVGEIGLEVSFARKVLASALREGIDERASGVVDVLVYNRNVDGSVVSQPVDVTWDDPTAEYVDTVRFRVSTDLALNRGCRVHIVLRGAFLLDRCCQPLDGTNVGGAARYVAPAKGGDWPEPPGSPAGCAVGPAAGPWAVAAAAPGSNFESWFYVPANGYAKKGVI